MLRKKLESESGESESGTEIADSGFLMILIYEKPSDPGFGLPSSLVKTCKKNKHVMW